MLAREKVRERRKAKSVAEKGRRRGRSGLKKARDVEGSKEVTRIGFAAGLFG